MKVLGAQNREKKGLLGRSDPYVKLIMSDDRLPSKKTTVKRSNLNPEWNEDFKFVVIDLENQSLDVNVFNWAQAWLPLFMMSEVVFFRTRYQILPQMGVSRQ